jgi:uncharacterized protein (DUF736 family)
MLKTTQTVKEEKKEFDLKEAFVLWKNVSKSGKEYLAGFVNNEEKTKLKGFFNTDKKNPKEPDIRVYTEVNEKLVEVASLWTNVDKNEKKYVTGSTDEHEKLVGWFGKENQEMRPFVRVYYEKN